MISVVIPTLDAARTLPVTLASLVGAAVEGLVKEVLVADAGSADATLEIADDAGAKVVRDGVAAACAAARGDWLLILEPGVKLSPDWETAAAILMARGWDRAGRFRASKDGRRPSRLLADALRLPLKGDEGLLVSRRLYDKVGGGEGRELLGRLRGRIDRLDALITR
ncbi:MAG: glycosyl transferase family 2 [Caulobacter sp.]|nr:glycosyl transferase family 2 [Caulobacter sp.]